MSALESTLVRSGCKTALWLGVLLFVITTAVFSSAWNNDFVVWDDNSYIHNQPHVLNGIRSAGILWAMTANVCNNWHPLTLISLQLDAQLFGPGPFGFHRTAVFLHAINSALAFCAIFSLTGCRWKSLIVAALFALHPTRVESVAWISERKDVLSGFFFFLTLIAYSPYARRPSIGRYLLVALPLALGLCAKSMLVTTPCVLLLLDYWPLRRFQNFSANESRQFVRLMIEKVPLLGLSAAVSVLTVIYQKTALSLLINLPIGKRVENAARGCVGYLVQTCWPAGLSHLYSIPPTSAVKFLASLSLLFLLTVVAVWQRGRRPYLLVGWLWFLGMLVPVCGLIQVGTQQRADRYLYLAQIGLFLALVWGVSDYVQKSRRGKIVSIGLVIASLCGCSFATVRQIQVWRDTKSLWQNAHQLEPHNRLAILSLICWSFAEGDRAEALRLADEMILIENRSDHRHVSRLAEILADNGEYETCGRALTRALELRPDPNFADVDLFLSRGESFAAQGRWDEAVDDYRQVTLLSPNAVPLRFCLAHALAKCGRQTESDQIRRLALQRFPRWPESAIQSAWKLCISPDAGPKNQFKAVCLAEEANAATGGQRADYLDVLAAAYASNRQFQEAVTTGLHAIQRAESEQQLAHAARIRMRLELYKNQQSYTE